MRIRHILDFLDFDFNFFGKYSLLLAILQDFGKKIFDLLLKLEILTFVKPKIYADLVYFP